MIGTADRQKHFHPFGICISTNETGDDFRFLFESLKKVVFDVMQLQYLSKNKIYLGVHLMTTLNFARSMRPFYVPMIGNKANAILCIIQEEAKTISIGQKRKRVRPKKQKAALFYQNDCDLSSSENESNPEQAVVEQEPPSDSVNEKESVTEATGEATVDLPRKRGRPKKSTTQGKKTKIN
ncbi:hypothetical protein BpHYR1_035571 [Brachionus plicatilis]|uniref:MULE transposase domain-containing protein n=1 Tax=Brachionus plicatilis TaxID=10195 RepID=A0A3M7PDW5_BRAPC|nr:hypothetical protein BpHYR1_035571 [Brachionus plicatilis]